MAAKKTTAAPAGGFYSPESGKDEPKPVDVRATAEGQKGASGLPHVEAVRLDAKQPEMTADAGLSEQPDERAKLRADIERIRSVRKPFGALTQKLAYPARSGYHRHWFSDEPGRVDEAASNGWAHVNDEQDKPVRRVVGRGRDGQAMYGYLMELPEVFWKEDMQAKNDAAQARVDEIKKNPIRAKPGQGQQSDQGKFYSPNDAPLTISSSVVRSTPR